eukprot:ANDGO_06595.mRNA.1 putative protein arginine N-methyltransferase 6.2
MSSRGKEAKSAVLGHRKDLKDDSYYFDSYSHISIHQEMIQDRVRTEAYRNAILQNKKMFEGKTVIDLGAGTGILSFFCAQAGAKKVYAVEASGIATQAEAIAKHNSMDHIIQVVHSRAEEISDEVIPPGSVDIIVSEWMGYFLLYESMFDSVVYARERWLKPEGQMFPNKGRMYISAISDIKSFNDAIYFWENVYGIDMSCIMPFAKKCAFEEPIVDTFDPNGIISNAVLFKDIDCKSVTAAELDDFESPFDLVTNDSDWFNGFISWFDCEFPAAEGEKPVILSTSPESTNTHWATTLFYVFKPMKIHKNEHIKGKLRVAKSAEHQRLVDISFDYTIRGVDYSQKFTMR